MIAREAGMSDNDLDAFGKRLHFGCGFFLGLGAAIWFVVDHGISGWGLGATLVTLPILFGLLAYSQGDKFWYEFLRRF